ASDTVDILEYSVTMRGGTIHFAGTSAADTVTFTGGSSLNKLLVDGSLFAFPTDLIESFSISAGGGSDSLTVKAYSADDTATVNPTTGEIDGLTYTVTWSGVEQTDLTAGGGGGTDKAYLYDSSGNDELWANSAHATLSGTGFSNYVEDFDAVYA